MVRAQGLTLAQALQMHPLIGAFAHAWTDQLSRATKTEPANALMRRFRLFICSHILRAVAAAEQVSEQWCAAVIFQTLLGQALPLRVCGRNATDSITLLEHKTL